MSSPRRGVVLFHSRAASFPEKLLAGATSFVVVGSPLWIPPLLWYLYRRKLRSRRQRLLFWLGVGFLLLYPHRHWAFFQRSRIWNAWLRYLRVRVVAEAPLDRERRRPKVYAMSPHGVFPFTIAMPLLSDLARRVFVDAIPVCATVVLRVPVLRQTVLWLGAVEAAPEAMEGALRQGKSLAVTPGGIAEMFQDYREEEEAIVLQSRKGFVRLAMRTGADLVPVFTFGASRLLRRVPLPSGLAQLSRRLRMSLLLFFGRFGLPVPFEEPLLFAMARPITFEAPVLDPSDAQVDEVHAEVMRAMARLFETYKDDYGWGHRTLRID